MNRNYVLRGTLRYSDRIKCILLLDLGKSIDSICEYLFLSRGSVNNYHSRYVEGGLEELTSDDYPGTECRLKEAELDKLSLHLEENLYQTVASIRDYIELSYKVQYSFGGLSGAKTKKLKPIRDAKESTPMDLLMRTILMM